MKLTHEFAPIREWAGERGIYDKGDVKTQFVKLSEEMGELAEAIIKDKIKDRKDAIGDMVVVLTNLAKLDGYSIEECINLAYEEIKNRKGKMVNNSFVKEESLKEMGESLKEKKVIELKANGRDYFNLPVPVSRLEGYLNHHIISIGNVKLKSETVIRLARHSHSVGGVGYIRIDDIDKINKEDIIKNESI